MPGAVLTLNGVQTPYTLVESMFSTALKIDAVHLTGQDLFEAVFKVDTYEDYLFEIKVTRPTPTPDPEPTPNPIPEPQLKRVYAAFTLREEEPIFFSDQVRVKYHFTLSNEDGALNTDTAYLASNYKITLNGTRLTTSHFTLVKSNWNQPVTKVILDAQYLQNLVLQGENTLTIEQEGYETQTVTFIGAKE